MILVEWAPKPDPLYVWSKDNSSVLALQWARKTQGLKLEWHGPDGLSITATSDNRGERSIAAIIGPQGREGIQGSPGPQGVAGNVVLPNALDGGNF